MRFFYSYIAPFCRSAIGARTPHLLVCLLLLAGWSPALGQVGCTYRAGTISFVARGGSTNPTYQTQYLLTDSDGRITATSTTASFSGVSAGSYQVYALNYDPTKTLSGNTVGSLVSQLAGPCFDVSAPFPINVCPREGSACDYTVGTITFRASGGNTSPGYLTRYVLTDSTGQIKAVTSAASFSVSSPGTYLAYGFNYKDDGSVTGLSVGQSLSAVTANCLDRGIPLIVAVCAQQLVSLLPKVYLQGALFGVPGFNPLMRDDLRTKGQVPLNSPYPALGFTELTTSSATTSGVLSTTGADAIVDWVFVELRSPTSSSVVVDSRSALVQRDGDIVGVDGVSPLIFSQAGAGSYYVAVRHRNHLGVMSQNALPLSSTASVVDFRQPSTPTFSFDPTNPINQAQVVVDQGRALWAGNTKVDNQVIYQGTDNDVYPINLSVLNGAGNIFMSPNFILGGYQLGDVNLNGETIFQGTTNDVDYIYQNVTRNHPGNALKVNNFIILEQIP